MLGIVLLLTERLMEYRNSTYDANCHEHEGDDRPNHTPALRGSAVLGGKDAGIRSIHLAKDQIITLRWWHCQTRFTT